MQQVVEAQKNDGHEIIVIRSAAPNTIYVPHYDVSAVYGPGRASPAYGVTFSPGITAPSDVWKDGIDWKSRDIKTGIKTDLMLMDLFDSDADIRESGQKWQHGATRRCEAPYTAKGATKRAAKGLEMLLAE